jgi:hypothetical protein
MIKRQENVIPILVLEEENTNEDVEPHAQINGNDMSNFFYNYPTHPLKWRGWVGFFFSFFCYNTFINSTP